MNSGDEIVWTRFSVRGSLGTEDYCREVEVGGFVEKDRGRWNWDGALLLFE